MNNISIFTGYKSYNVSNSGNFNKRCSTLLRCENCDKITFTSKKGKEMSFYSICNNNQEFVPTTEHEKAFDNIMKKCMELSKKENTELNHSEKSALSRSYLDLFSDIEKNKSNKKALSYMFCSLSECFDKSKSKEISETMRLLLFYNFLPVFETNETIIENAKKIVSDYVFEKKNLGIRLKRLFYIR